MSAAKTPIPAGCVLLIDDHTLFREGLLCLFAARHEWRSAAGCYPAAAGLARRFPADVAIFGFCREEGGRTKTGSLFRRQFPRLPVLLLDDVVRTRNVQNVLSGGAHGYWTKQAPFSQLLQALLALRRGGRSFCPEVRPFVLTTPKGLVYHPPHGLPPIHVLTPREHELFLLLARGLTLRLCAGQMGVSVNTADNHRSRLMQKLNVHKAVDLARLAVQEGLLAEG
jgi:DNA-binding NarL/FixJ family response regulator